MRCAPALLLALQALAAQEIRTVQIATGLPAPTDIQNAADGSGRLFVVQQNGLIPILRSGAVLPAPFLDIRAKTTADGERGLLGLAFPPAFVQKQHFYVDYTDLHGDTVIAQYRVTANPDSADPASETILLKIAQPFANHNGGQIRFGPDGFLYIAMGDGGSAGDPQGNGQNLHALLGKLLRVDVESAAGQIRIPGDNPFVNTAGARPEIWAYGLRNPWRFSFDRANRDLWIADVGQDAYEEVDYQPASNRGGENYGWNLMEGMHCYQAGCSTQGLTLPIVEYPHSDGACSIVGGFVYRGNLSPGLRGVYLYGDLCNGRIWGVERQGGAAVNRLLLSSGFGITTFGEDEAGEVYVANAADGSIYRIEGSRAPRLTAAAVVNAASFADGLTPGSLTTVFAAGVRDAPGSAIAGGVPLPLALEGVSITVGGVAAPIDSVSNVDGQEQVNFQAPWEAAGRAAADIVVTRDGQSSAPASVPVSQVQPGVYGVVVHAADYSVVTAAHPLAAGEYAFVYASGLGAVSNTPADGAGGPLAPLAAAIADVRVSLGGVPCDVQFAGLAPGFVGVYQVNFRAPAALPAGALDLVVTAAEIASPPIRL